MARWSTKEAKGIRTAAEGNKKGAGSRSEQKEIEREQKGQREQKGCKRGTARKQEGSKGGHRERKGEQKDTKNTQGSRKQAAATEGEQKRQKGSRGEQKGGRNLVMGSKMKHNVIRKVPKGSENEPKGAEKEEEAKGSLKRAGKRGAHVPHL